MKIELYFLIALFVVGFTSSSFAQEKQLKWKSKVIVKFLDGRPNYKGTLVSIEDSSIVFSQYKEIAFPPDPALIENYKVQEIKLLKIRRKNAVGKGAGIGALAGIVIGGSIGFASGDDPPGWFSYSAEEKATALGISGCISAAVVGALLGITKNKFRINGLQQNYENYKSKLMKYEMMLKWFAPLLFGLRYVPSGRIFFCNHFHWHFL